jgi:hypothetical protein
MDKNNTILLNFDQQIADNGAGIGVLLIPLNQTAKKTPLAESACRAEFPLCCSPLMEECTSHGQPRAAT